MTATHSKSFKISYNNEQGKPSIDCSKNDIHNLVKKRHVSNRLRKRQLDQSL